jgi:predicted ATPase with chaperone activity
LVVTRIYSVADMLPSGMPLVQHRPFRSPHHTISHAGLVGGGNWPRPGEISLAHRGVLFLDELPEFPQRVLEVMRQPLEDKLVTISRAQGSLTSLRAANFMLVAAARRCGACPPQGLLRRPGEGVHLLALDRDPLPEARLRPIARPHRHSYRSAASGLQQADRRPAG